MAGSAKMSIQIIGDAASAKRAFHETGTAAEESGSKVEKAGEKMRDMAVETLKTFAPMAAGLGAAEFAKGAIEGAEKLEKANRSLEVALKTVGNGAEKLLPQFQDTAKAAAQFGINQTQATESLSRAVLITHNAQAAQRAYNEAVVISKATGKDLNAVLLATAKAQDGQTGSLTRYGVILKKGADGQQQFNAVMGAFKGQAEANTSASDKLSADWDNLQAQIGSKLLPAFDAIVGGLTSVVNWLESPQVAAAVSTFAQTIQNFIQPVIDWVQTNWPEIKQVIEQVLRDAETVVRSILSGLEAFWKSWGGTIMTIVHNTFNGVKQAIEGVVNVIEGVIKIVDGLIHGRWSEVWNGIKQVVTGAFQWLLAYPETLLKDLGAVFAKVGTSILSAIGAGLNAGKRLLLNALDAAIIGPINAVIGLIDSFHINIPKVHIPLIGDVGGGSIGFNIPKIPLLDTGGVVAETGLAVVHRGEVWSGVGPNARSMGTTINVTVNAPNYVGTVQELSNAVANAIRGGRVPALVSAIQAV